MPWKAVIYSFHKVSINKTYKNVSIYNNEPPQKNTILKLLVKVRCLLGSDPSISDADVAAKNYSFRLWKQNVLRFKRKDDLT